MQTPEVRSIPRLDIWQAASSSRKRKLQFLDENTTDREGGDKWNPTWCIFVFWPWVAFFWNLYIFYSRHKMPVYTIRTMCHFVKNIHLIMIWHNIWFSWNLCNDEKVIYFVMYDFYFHNYVYNYKKVTTIMVKINIYIIVDLCMLHTSSS